MLFLLSLALLILQPVNADTAAFHIHVVGQRHENVGNVWVRVPVSSGSDVLLYPNDEGIITIHNLPVGTFQVRLSALGYQTWTSDLQVTGKQECPLVVTLKNGVVICAPHYVIQYDNEPGLPSVRGIVNDESGRTLSRIQLDWQRANEKKPFPTISSNKKGQFVVPQIAPGAYRLTINPRMGWNRERLSFEVVVPGGEVPFITVVLSLKNAVEICQ